LPHLLGDNGWRWRVLRTSNAYNFRDPGTPSGEDESSKANFQSGTPNERFFFSSLGGAWRPRSSMRKGILLGLNCI